MKSSELSIWIQSRRNWTKFLANQWQITTTWNCSSKRRYFNNQQINWNTPKLIINIFGRIWNWFDTKKYKNETRRWIGWWIWWIGTKSLNSLPWMSFSKWWNFGFDGVPNWETFDQSGFNLLHLTPCDSFFSTSLLFEVSQFYWSTLNI